MDKYKTIVYITIRMRITKDSGRIISLMDMESINTAMVESMTDNGWWVSQKEEARNHIQISHIMRGHSDRDSKVVQEYSPILMDPSMKDNLRMIYFMAMANLYYYI